MSIQLLLNSKWVGLIDIMFELIVNCVVQDQILVINIAVWRDFYRLYKAFQKLLTLHRSD